MGFSRIDVEAETDGSLWAYNPLNRDDTGDDVCLQAKPYSADDQWNAENFSWYSSHNRDLAIKASGQEKSFNPNTGARLLDAIVVSHISHFPYIADV